MSVRRTRALIQVTEMPSNEKHFRSLIGFAVEVLQVATAIGIDPILSSSLAVFAYTREPSLAVNDIDLACHEYDFRRLKRALEARQIDCDLTTWHVLRARRGDLKVEFDALEYWMPDVGADVRIEICGFSSQLVSLTDLKKLYRRGLDSLNSNQDHATPKRRAMLEKMALLSQLGGI